jgi:hypothetical protein
MLRSFRLDQSAALYGAVPVESIRIHRPAVRWAADEMRRFGSPPAIWPQASVAVSLAKSRTEILTP